MSDSVFIVLILCATLVVLMGLWWLKEVLSDADQAIKGHVDEALTNPRYAPDDTLTNMPPLPVEDGEGSVDIKVYRPRPDTPYPPPQCICHNRPLRPGQRFAWVTLKTGEVRVTCLDREPK